MYWYWLFAECLVERVVSMQDYIKVGESLLDESTQLREDQPDASRATSSSQISGVIDIPMSQHDGTTVDADSERRMLNDENRPLKEIFDEKEQSRIGDERSGLCNCFECSE